MGTYTQYAIRTKNKEDYDKVFDMIFRNNQYYNPNADDDGEYQSNCPLKWWRWNGGDGPKWYKNDRDCLKVSSLIPDIEFELLESCLEDERYIASLYKNGKYHSCRKLVEEDFDYMDSLVPDDEEYKDYKVNRSLEFYKG